MKKKRKLGKQKKNYRRTTTKANEQTDGQWFKERKKNTLACMECLKTIFSDKKISDIFHLNF